MMVLLLEIVGSLALGHALVGGLFWGLLQVPESTVWMLGLSGLLAVLLLAVTGLTEVMALLAWSGITPFATRARRSLSAFPAFLMGALVLALVWWPTGQIMEWLGVHRGEIDAWLMLHLGWTRTAWIHSGVEWIIWLVGYGLGLSVGLTLMAALAARGYRELQSGRWLRAALAPRQFLTIAFWLLLLVWGPWHFRYWRPRGLPPSWLEPAFVATKLALIYLLMNLGWALVLKGPASRLARTERATRPDAGAPDAKPA